MKKIDLSDLPQIEKLLEEPALKRYFHLLSRPLVAGIASKKVNDIRGRVKNGETLPGKQGILKEIESILRDKARKRVTRVINATGIVLHTNMGRAPIPGDVWKASSGVNTGFSNLELDLESGKRGKRNGLIPELLSLLVGSEDALVVNNNAAAVFLLLAVFAGGREVIVSRGEQVQIGGGFRIPEILALSGARLVEVGTTNVTRISDYSRAMSTETAMVLVVHNSNFRIRGFTESPPLKDLAATLPEGIILAVDQGSGTTTEEIPGEVKAGLYLRRGAHLVSFSGDKILGGPQAGLIAGRKDLIGSLSRHPLMRVFRPGKAIYSLLEEFLVRKLNGRTGYAEQVISTPQEELKKRGRKVLRGLDPAKLSLVPAAMAAGGGSAPDESFPSVAIELDLPGKPEDILAVLRRFDPPIIGRIHAGRVRLDLAAVDPGELGYLRSALQTLLGANDRDR